MESIEIRTGFGRQWHGEFFQDAAQEIRADRRSLIDPTSKPESAPADVNTSRFSCDYPPAPSWPCERNSVWYDILRLFPGRRVAFVFDGAVR